MRAGGGKIFLELGAKGYGGTKIASQSNKGKKWRKILNGETTYAPRSQTRDAEERQKEEDHRFCN